MARSIWFQALKTYLGNFRVMHRMMKEMGVDYTLMSDPSEVLDTPADGTFRMYAGARPKLKLKTRPMQLIRCYCNLGNWKKPKSLCKPLGINPLPPSISPWGCNGLMIFL